MADEVTKKDLQSLQGYCNKQIGEAETRVMAKIAEVEKNIYAFLNKAIEGVNKNDAELLRGHARSCSTRPSHEESWGPVGMSEAIPINRRIK